MRFIGAELYSEFSQFANSNLMTYLPVNPVRKSYCIALDWVKVTNQPLIDLLPQQKRQNKVIMDIIFSHPQFVPARLKEVEDSIEQPSTDAKLVVFCGCQWESGCTTE